MPPEMLCFYARQREILQPGERSTVRVDDYWNSPKVLDRFPPEMQEPPELLLKRVPLRLGKR